MDHLSSSTLTGTTTYTQQSVTTFHQDVPKQTYTTAGTIYNPNNSQPLQPPVRRGRTLKWPPPGAPSTELSLFPKSVLAGLNLRTQGLCDTNTSPLPKYSPLQQNYDRAVSPGMDQIREFPCISAAPSIAASRVSSANMGSMPSPGALTSAASKQLDADSTDGTDDEGPDEGTLKGMAVKTLHNLASYPNPNQKNAQKALLRAQRNGTPAPSTGTNGSRSATPLYPLRIPPGLGDAPEPNRDASHSATFPRSVKNNATQILKLKPNRGPVGYLGSGFSSLPPRATSDALATKWSSNAGEYRTTLATGPGAPLPLTAGPPGLRQHRAATAEIVMIPLQQGLEGDILSNEDPSCEFRSGPHGMRWNTRQYPPQVSGAATPDILKAGLPRLVNGPTSEASEKELHAASQGGSWPLAPVLGYSKRIYDHKKPEEVLKYYPKGQPTFYPAKSDHWVDGRPPIDQPRLATRWMSDEELDRRNERTNRLFHAATGELGKPMETILRDARMSQFRRSLGVIGDRRRPAQTSTDVEHPILSAEDVNSMTNKEAGEPFVNMTFAAILDHLEEGMKQGGFHEWMHPVPSVIDSTDKGRQSIFGK